MKLLVSLCGAFGFAISGSDAVYNPRVDVSCDDCNVSKEIHGDDARNFHVQDFQCNCDSHLLATGDKSEMNRVTTCFRNVAKRCNMTKLCAKIWTLNGLALDNTTLTPVLVMHWICVVVAIGGAFYNGEFNAFPWNKQDIEGASHEGAALDDFDLKDMKLDSACFAGWFTLMIPAAVSAVTGILFMILPVISAMCYDRDGKKSDGFRSVAHGVIALGIVAGIYHDRRLRFDAGSVAFAGINILILVGVTVAFLLFCVAAGCVIAACSSN